MTNTDPNEWVLLNTDLTTKLAILPAAQSHLYFVMNEPGSGELKIPLESEAASLVASGMFCQASYRGAERGGFFVENISKQHANAEEGGRQWLSISGRGAMALLEDAIAWNDGTTDTTREFTNVTKASILITLLTEAQARGGLSALTWDFDAVNDSASIAWTDSETLKLTVGTSLLDVVRQFAKVGIDFEMQYSAGGFILSAYENGLGTDKAETIYFRVGTNCEEVYSDERGDVIQNALLVTYKSGSVALTDPTSIAARRRRESLLDARGAQTASSATTYGAAILDGRKDPRRGISIKLYDGVNPRAFVDYELGDYVTLDKFGVEDRYRILGIQCTFDNDQFANIVVELNSLLVENQIEMAQDLNWLLNEWNTANDANLMAVSYWAAIGAEGDTLDKANALHIIGTKLYVAAWFSNEIVGGVVCPTGIAIYDLQTGVWSTPSTAGSFLSDYPTCLTSIGTDLYVGYGSGEHVQKYDTVADTWSSLDGGLYYSVEPDQGTVNAIATDGTDIYVTGKFNEAGSPAVTVANIAKFTVATSTWSALGTGINNIGYSLLCSGSNVYAGGAFTSPSSYIAVWNGTTWAAMDSGLDGIVYSLILYGTNILAGGAFTGKISEWNGSAWTVFGGGVDNTVYALAVYLTDVYVGGAFTDAGNRISRYSGGSWWLLGNGTGTSTVFAICLYGDDVYVGGNFTEVGDAKPAIRLAVYFNNFESLTNYLENSSSNFNMGAAIHAATASAISDSDELPFWEDVANALRKITWANIKATLKTYFDTLYLLLTGNGATSQLLQWTATRTAKWITMSGDATIADDGAVSVSKMSVGAGQNAVIRMGDNAAVNKVVFADYDNIERGYIDSDGHLVVSSINGLSPDQFLTGTGWPFTFYRLLYTDVTGNVAVSDRLIYDPTSDQYVFGGQSGSNNANIRFGGNTGNASAPNSTNSFFRLIEYGVPGSSTNLFRGTSVRGTKASPTAPLANDVFVRLNGGGYTGSGNVEDSSSTGGVEIVADENQSTTTRGTRVDIYTTPNTTATKTKAFTVNADGTVNIASGKTYNINGNPHTHTGLNLENHLINGGFNFWQRITPTTATAMTDDIYNAPDRWYSLVQGAGATINRNAGIGKSQYSAKLIAGGTTNRYGIAQIIEAENSIPLRGQTVIAQCRIKPVNNAGSGTRDYRIAILEWTGTADTVTSELVADWTSSTFTTAGFFASTTKTLVGTAVVTATHNTETVLSVSGAVSTSCNNLIVFIWTEDVPTHASDYVLIGESGLYSASELQIWNAERVSDEQARCLRYYEVVPKEDAGIIGFGQCYATTNAYVHLIYSEKRIVATPTIVNPTTDFVVANAGGGNVTVTSFGTTTRKTRSSSLIFPVTASGLVAGNATMLYGTTAKITIDAEL